MSGEFGGLSEPKSTIEQTWVQIVEQSGHCNYLNHYVF